MGSLYETYPSFLVNLKFVIKVSRVASFNSFIQSCKDGIYEPEENIVNIILQTSIEWGKCAYDPINLSQPE